MDTRLLAWELVHKLNLVKNLEEKLLRKKQISKITIFTIVITCLDLCFQWSNIFQLSEVPDYTSSFPASLVFLLAWLLFSLYWGIDKDKKYQKFITIYWGVNIFVNIVIVVFANSNFIQEVLFLPYIWYEGSLYGLGFLATKFSWLDTNIYTAILVISPLMFSYIGFWLGGFIAKWTRVQ